MKTKITTLEIVLKELMTTLQKATDTVQEQDVSNYPIVVASTVEVELGIALLTHREWFFRISTLEEFVVKSIIANDKIEDFKQNYRAHTSHICIFAYLSDETDTDTEGGAHILFMPRA